MAEEKRSVTRRNFGKALAKAGAAAAAAAPVLAQTPAPAPAGQTPGAPQMGPVVVGNYAMVDQLVFGGIGIRSRGIADLRQLLGDQRVRFVAIADVRESARETVKSTVHNYYKNHDCVCTGTRRNPRAHDINVLLIATSDRWHGPMAMWAAQSGKDMYIEKPGAMSINESYAVADNVRRYGVVYQSGCQRKNQYRVRVRGRTCAQRETGQAAGRARRHRHRARDRGRGRPRWWRRDAEPDPLVFDWDKWLGPCLWRPYNSNYADRGRGEFWDFHAGLFEWASHTVAMAQWAADMEHTEPVEYVPAGPTYRGDGLIERYTIYCRYANGVQLILRNHSWGGLGSCSNRFEGTEGGSNRETAEESRCLRHLKSLAADPLRGPATIRQRSTSANSAMHPSRTPSRAECRGHRPTRTWRLTRPGSAPN